MKYDSKKLKEMSVDALKHFDNFCKENNLTYSLAFGTELGAIRHKGFIPWDDDLDVDMPIEDYLKLEKLWNKDEKNCKYFLQTKSNELYKPTLFYQIRQNGTTWIEPEKESIPMNWGIAIIDIFPLYHMPNNPFLKKIQRKLYSIANAKCSFPYRCYTANMLKKRFSRFMSLLALRGVKLLSDISKKSNLMYYSDSYNGKQEIEKSILFPPTIVEFENNQFYGHANPDKYLTQQYGDYMTPPPENQRDGHPIGIIDLDKDYHCYIKL